MKCTQPPTETKHDQRLVDKVMDDCGLQTTKSLVESKITQIILNFNSKLADFQENPSPFCSPKRHLP
jgi:hypothetical protein